MERKVRVRFAPSPTGPLHMGGVRTALYNYLFAKKHHGDFILRIEDTDQGRFVPGAEDYIVKSLEWCGITFDEGVHLGGPHSPYRQSERKDIYKKYAIQLIESGHAYYAFDTSEELDQMRETLKAMGNASPQYNYITRENMKNSLTLPQDEVSKLLESGVQYVIRIKIPRKEEVRVEDLIRGTVLVHTAQMDDKVLFKSDGMPTYHLANIVDDYLMEITHVIRGEEWLPSAPLHVLLYRYLGWEDVMPKFAHLPLLLKPDGNGKLSKRDGDRLGFPVFPMNWIDPFTGETSSGYKEADYYPEAFINMLVLLGWNPGTTQEIFSEDELIEQFNIERISKSGAKFDSAKTRWFNQQYLRKQSNESLAEVLKVDLVKNSIKASDDFIFKVIQLVKEKAHFSKELWSLSDFIFVAREEFDSAITSKRWNAEIAEFMSSLAKEFATKEKLSISEVDEVLKNIAEKHQFSVGQIMQILRVSLTGIGTGPALNELIALLGGKEIAQRLIYSIKTLS